MKMLYTTNNHRYNQARAPIYEALVERRRRNESSYHVPGHKFGSVLEVDCKPWYEAVMGLDYTEINGLDDLHHAEGIIQEAQVLAAACFGADRSWFLVGGSTAGNLALITTVCSRGDVILVQRNAHKSVIHGLMLAGARAVFLQPSIDPITGLAAAVPLEAVKEALERYPEAKALFLTNPNYYGMGVHLKPYAAAAHGAGIPLLVDEAHGAHFGLHSEVPASALSEGADAVVQSTHKMLTAMTMGAMLHTQGNRVDREKLQYRLAMLQSSSPSYPLMASLDLARRQAALHGNNLLDATLAHAHHLHQQAAKGCTALRLVHPKAAPTEAYDWLDPLKLLIYDGTGQHTGFELQSRLEESGIIAEMADDRYVVLASSLATPQEDWERLLQSLQEVDKRIAHHNHVGVNPPDLLPIQKAGISQPIQMDMDMPPPQALEPVPLEYAAGRVSGASVIPYPPGIPILFPGEAITQDNVQQISLLIQAGARFQGTLLQEASGCSILVKKVDWGTEL